MQKVTLIGNLGRDPEEKTTSNGKKFISISLGVNSSKNETTWYQCNIWEDRLPLFSGMLPHLKKGSRVLVMGDLSQMSTYEAKDGTTKVSCKVNPFSITFVGAKPEKSAEYLDLESRVNERIKQNDSLYGHGGSQAALRRDDDLPF